MQQYWEKNYRIARCPFVISHRNIPYHFSYFRDHEEQNVKCFFACDELEAVNDLADINHWERVMGANPQA